MPRTGPKESTATKRAVELYLKHRYPVPKCAYLTGTNPSTVYRALARRKQEKR